MNTIQFNSEDGNEDGDEDDMKESLEKLVKDFEKIGFQLPSFKEMLKLISKDDIKEKCEKDPEQAFEELFKNIP